LTDFAKSLEDEGARRGKTVQSKHGWPDRAKCDMGERILRRPDGPRQRGRGGLARGRILDSGALEQTVVEVEKRLDGAELVILNEFGKRETEGKGLVPIIAAALDRATHVLIGVNSLNLPLFLAFCDNFAMPLNVEIDGVVE